MSLIGSVLGFGSFGFAARCFQLGLQKRNMFDAPLGHVYATAAFGLIGYGVFEMEKRQEVLLADKKKRLLEIREKENAAYLAQREAST